jgi:serine/threonine protein kinase
MIAQIKQAINNLGKFDNLKDIDEGANAYSFLADHKHLKEKRFLKVIEVPKGEDDSILREPRALLEALQAKPISENIVQLYDADIIKVEADNLVLLQMEYLNGTSLQKLLERRTFGQQEAVRLTTGILHGVAHLHRQRFVHRDLKPGNILLHNGIPKIADFGSIAKVSDSCDFVHASKHSDLYVPPEGWLVPPRYTFSSDIYQVALVFYQLINGAFPTNGQHYLTRRVLKKLQKLGTPYEGLHPFDASKAEKESIAELTAKEKLIHHALSARPYFTGSIDRIIRKALRANLDGRFMSAEECLDKLSKISVPNWKPIEHYFEALKWKQKDWRICEIKKKKAIQVVVSKCNCGADKHRVCSTADTLEKAFRFVEEYRG